MHASRLDCYRQGCWRSELSVVGSSVKWMEEGVECGGCCLSGSFGQHVCCMYMPLVYECMNASGRDDLRVLQDGSEGVGGTGWVIGGGLDCMLHPKLLTV